MNNIVSIVGRPNVGKSTLFNRLIQRREAIVDSVSGVTRDRNYGKSEWNGKEFSVIDTGGYIRGSDDVFEGEIRKQVELAIDEADVIIFVVDVEEGITPMDDVVARLLRKVTKPVLLAVNKVDNAMREKDAIEFYNLGLGEYYTFASISGSGTGDLLDALIDAFPVKPEPVQETESGFTFFNKTPDASKAMERRNKLKEFNSRYQQFDNENVFETVPAFKRKNINIDGSNASDQHINTYLSDNNGSMQLRENRFLNKDVD